MDRSNTISLFDVVRFIDGFDADGKPNTFNITWCTLDKNKQKGGRQLSAEKCMKAVAIDKEGKAVLAKPTKEVAHSAAERNPNHYRNQTRNIMVNGTNHIRKIRIRLIERFNGKVVSYG